MNKNYPIYKTTFIDDMRSLVEEAAQNFPDSIAISYKDKPSDKEVKKVSFSQWRDLINHECTEEDKGDACEVHKGGNDPAILEEYTCKERDYGKLRTAGHKGCKHCGCSAFTLVADCSASHNSGNCTARAYNKRNNRFAA